MEIHHLLQAPFLRLSHLALLESVTEERLLNLTRPLIPGESFASNQRLIVTRSISESNQRMVLP